MINNKVDGSPYSVAVVLRENGMTDFYYNFNLVEENTTVPFDDIEFDFNYLYLRGRQEYDEIPLYRIPTTWAQRIGLSVAVCKNYGGSDPAKTMNRKWNDIKSKRVSAYMRLYSSFCQLVSYFMIAHRNIVSIFDLSTEKWSHHVYEDTVRYVGLTVRNNTKTSEALGRFQNFSYIMKYKVGIVVGSSEVHYLRITDNGQPPEPDKRVTKSNGIIRRCMKDELKFHGIYMLIADRKPFRIMHLAEQNIFNTFELNQGTETDFTLGLLTENEIWPLLDSRDPAIKALEILSENTCMVNYNDLWPESGNQEKTQSGLKENPTNLRKNLVVFNPQKGKLAAFTLKSARILMKPGNEHFGKPGFQGVKCDGGPIFELDLS